MLKDIENNTIEEVLDEVGLLDKVQSFTQGINTIIGEEERNVIWWTDETHRTLPSFSYEARSRYI